MITTGNPNFDAWGEVFEERVIATAIPDMRSIMQAPSISGEKLLPVQGEARIRAEEPRTSPEDGESSTAATGEYQATLDIALDMCNSGCLQ